jgi:hypothetical protein
MAAIEDPREDPFFRGRRRRHGSSVQGLLDSDEYRFAEKGGGGE